MLLYTFIGERGGSTFVAPKNLANHAITGTMRNSHVLPFTTVMPDFPDQSMARCEGALDAADALLTGSAAGLTAGAVVRA